MNSDRFLIWICRPDDCLRLYRRPQALLFLLKTKLPFWKRRVLFFFSSIFGVFTYLGKTSNRRGAQSCAEKLSMFVLNSHLDPIGEQNDVQYWSIPCQYIYMYTYVYIYIYTCSERIDDMYMHIYIMHIYI